MKIKEIKWLYQGNEKTCGQHCIAMATGIDLQIVKNVCLRFTGSKGGTTVKNMYETFAYLGHVVDWKLSDTECKYAIISFHHHWALKVGDMVYDSSLGVYKFSEIHKFKVRKVRFLELPAKMFEI